MECGVVWPRIRRSRTGQTQDILGAPRDSDKTMRPPGGYALAKVGLALGAAVLALIGAVSATTQCLPVAFDRSTVANNGTTPPGSDRLFNSCNQPSVNERGMVAFRARSKGGQGLGEPLRGIYMRDMVGRTPGPLATNGVRHLDAGSATQQHDLSAGNSAPSPSFRRSRASP
jgi:hypothetical protein